MIRARRAVVILAVVALAGCATSGPFTAGHVAASPSFSGYLGTGPGFVEFLSLHDQGGGNSTGDFIFDQSENTGNSSQPYQLSSNDASASMIVNGSHVTLDVGGDLGTTFYGTLNGSTLTLEIPDTSTGMISSGTLTASSSAAFNSAVARLKGSIGRANANAEAQTQAQAQVQQTAQDEQTLKNDVSGLRSDTGNLPGDLSTLSGDVQTISGDVGTVKSDLKQGGNSYCSNQMQAGYDAGQADYDTGQLGYDVNSFQSDMGTIWQDIHTVKSDIATLKSDGGTVPNSAYDAIDNAKATMSQAISTANGDISQGDAYDQQAASIADAAATGSCSGDGPGKPSNLVSQLKG